MNDGLGDLVLRERLLGADPVPWLLESDEPAARWATLTQVLMRREEDSEVLAARADVVEDPGVQALIGRLPHWENPGALSGHDGPSYAPNLLNLLADMGLREDDDPRIGHILDQMLEHQDVHGRFCARGEWKRAPGAKWGALLCDTHAIAEVLARYGRIGDLRLTAAFIRVEADLADTAQGLAWPCRPDDLTGFRGPGRKNDFCPLVTMQALRAFSYLPETERPEWLDGVAQVSLRAWLNRGEERPYMFGHGRQFKRVKWPATWYNSLTLLEAVGRYPRVWVGPGARTENTRAVAEIAACLIAYNLDPHTGQCTPRSCFRGFESYSFGQKKTSSPFATARVLATLSRFSTLADEIEKVDVLTLGSSKGGSGTPLPP